MVLNPVLRDRSPEPRTRFNDEADTLSTITLTELFHDAARPAESQRGREWPFSISTTGDNYAHLGKRGELLGPYDILVAGHARSRSLVVVTGNLKEVRWVDGLRPEDWMQPN